MPKIGYNKIDKKYKRGGTMKRKKILTFAVIATSMFLSFGCTQKEAVTEEPVPVETQAAEETKSEEIKYKDGEYIYEAPEFDSYGWKTYLKVHIKDSRIESVEFEGLDKDGKKKSELESYNKSMREKADMDFTEASNKLEESLVETQNIEKVDVVTGATHSSEDFKNQIKELIKAE